nr:hypothetical protein [Massilia sp. Se16.2.3]
MPQLGPRELHGPGIGMVGEQAYLAPGAQHAQDFRHAARQVGVLETILAGNEVEGGIGKRKRLRCLLSMETDLPAPVRREVREPCGLGQGQVDGVAGDRGGRAVEHQLRHRAVAGCDVEHARTWGHAVEMAAPEVRERTVVAISVAAAA